MNVKKRYVPAGDLRGTAAANRAGNWLIIFCRISIRPTCGGPVDKASEM